MSHLRKIILLWVMLWMMAIPLVHIHPETDHHHGDVGHIHGGIAHTVFSSDLPCEYTAHSSDTALVVLTLGAAHDLDHPEIGFSLAMSGDRYTGKAAPTDAIISATLTLSPRLGVTARSDSFPISPQSLLLLTSRLSRAPPGFSV